MNRAATSPLDDIAAEIGRLSEDIGILAALITVDEDPPEDTRHFIGRFLDRASLELRKMASDVEMASRVEPTTKAGAK